MLVQFKVKNYLSFKDEAVLDLSAINSYKEHEYNLIDIDIKEKFLKVAAIYGANASGKSNLFYAFRCFQNIIRESSNNIDAKLELNQFSEKQSKNDSILNKEFNPFKFCEAKENTEFEIIFLFEKFEYRYGFEYNNERIIAEWLNKKNISTNRVTTIFERDCDQINFGHSVRNSCDRYAEHVADDVLVLSFLNKLKLQTDVFATVYDGIMDTLVLSTDIYENRRFIKYWLETIMRSDKDNLLKFLSAVDTGIKEITSSNIDDEVEYFTHHIGEDGTMYELDLFNESAGTLKIMAVYISSFVCIEIGTSLFIDELNAKLHPFLLKFIIDLFHDEKNKAAQLIYTTHDTTLLDKKFFRRDQIWFVEKNEFGYSKLVALSDFKIRSDSSFEKDYLSGVYGGIPYIKEMDL